MHFHARDTPAPWLWRVVVLSMMACQACQARGSAAWNPMATRGVRTTRFPVGGVSCTRTHAAAAPTGEADLYMC
jgi:hypothetical protein